MFLLKALKEATDLNNYSIHNSTIDNVALSVRNDTFFRIEFKHHSVLSSDNTNYKNDIQLFVHPVDELWVNGDYH